MGQSTNAELNFGVIVDCEDEELPWHSEDDGLDFEEWWRNISGFKHSVPSPFDVDGNYLPGFNKDSPQISEYFAESRAWDAVNPPPVALVNYCSSECPMTMLAVPGAGLLAHRGDPSKFTPSALVVQPEAVEALTKFCRDHGIEYEGQPGWYLTSYWG
jgi:hypothetical protein